MPRSDRNAPFRPGWPLALLVLSALATAAAALQAYRLARSNAATVDRVLHDYADIATWNYGRYVTAALDEAVVEVLSPVMHFQMHGQLHVGNPPHASWFVDHYLDTSSPHYGDNGPLPGYLPRTYIGFVLGADTVGIAGDVPPDHVVAGLNARLTEIVRTAYEPGWAWGLDVQRVGDRPRIVAYTIMPMTVSATDTSPGDTAVYAFVTDDRLWHPLFEETYAQAPILPRTLTGDLGNTDVLAVALRTRTGDRLFGSHEDAPAEPIVEVELPEKFGGLYVSAAVLPDMAETLIIGGLPRSRLPYLLGLLALAVGLTLIALRQLRREQELVRLRADFVSNVSHELRTPLAQIRLFLETLRLGRARTPEQVEWSLANIDRETSRLDRLVERILTFSRLNREVELHLERVDVGAIVADTVELFRPLAAQNGTTIVLEAGGQAVASVDTDMLRQVVINLLDNAVKYGPPGQTVRVQLTRSDPVVRLVVTDEGSGVPQEERATIFRPFHRGSVSTRSGTGGGGIGLAIVARIVQAHGGTVSVTDTAGGGAAFTVEIPAGPAGDARAVTAVAALSPG